MLKFILISICLPLSLAACNTQKSIQHDSDDFHSAFVHTAPSRTFVLPNTIDQAVLTRSQSKMIDKALLEYHRRNKSKISIGVPIGALNEKELFRLKEMSLTYLSYSGIPNRDIDFFKYKTSNKKKSNVELVVSGIVGLRREDCGNWPDDILNSKDMKPYYNFGCAIRNNIAAQMTDPNEQFNLRKMTPPDGERSTNVLRSYRRVEPKDNAQK